MKKLFIIALGLAFTGTSFGQAKKFITLRADIAHRNGDVLYIKEGKNVLKTIKVNSEGFFKDTLSLKEGIYEMFDGLEYTDMYLKNGFDLKLKADAKQFEESIVYEGTGAKENNHLVQSTVLDHKFEGEIDNLLVAGEAEFKKALGAKKASDLKRLSDKEFDPNFVALKTKQIESYTIELQDYYAMKAALRNLNNTMTPSFTFENSKGGSAKLEDYKGKYVFIDVWATWCGPCRAEIPHMKKLEEKYHGKNIAFVSVSYDKPKDVEKWKKMVQEKEMKGEQLIASLETHTEMSKFFRISTIPRFILLDPQGKIINADAPRPSNPNMASLLDSLLK